MTVNLKISAECTDPKCGHTFQFIQESEGSSNYKATCGGCGAEYEGTAMAELTPPPGETATAAKTTTAPKTSSTTAGATT